MKKIISFILTIALVLGTFQFVQPATEAQAAINLVNGAGPEFVKGTWEGSYLGWEGQSAYSNGIKWNFTLEIDEYTDNGVTEDSNKDFYYFPATMRLVSEDTSYAVDYFADVTYYPADLKIVIQGTSLIS